MSRIRAYEHVYCNTDTERAKLARVKATVSIPPPLRPSSARNMHEKMHLRALLYWVIATTEIFYCSLELGTFELVVMTRERNCFRLCTSPRTLE